MTSLSELKSTPTKSREWTSIRDETRQTFDSIHCRIEDFSEFPRDQVHFSSPQGLLILTHVEMMGMRVTFSPSCRLWQSVGSEPVSEDSSELDEDLEDLLIHPSGSIDVEKAERTANGNQGLEPEYSIEFAYLRSQDCYMMLGHYLHHDLFNNPAFDDMESRPFEELE